MKLNKKYTIITFDFFKKLFAFIFLFSSTFSFAAPPVPFGSTTCPGGFTCSTDVQSTGMKQRTLVASDGTTYFQTSIQNGKTSNGGYLSYDTFVNGTAGASIGGVSAKASISQTGAQTFNYTTTLNLGWASDAGPAVDITQTVSDNYLGVGFTYIFKYKQNQNATGNTTGYFYDIYQRLTDSSILNGANLTGSTDIQTFSLRRAGGDFVPNAGSATLGAANAGPNGQMMGMGGGGGGMMKASINSKGMSTRNSVTLRKAFVPNPAGYGTDGVSTGTIGDSQTEPAAGTVFGVNDNPTFPNQFGGQRSTQTQSISTSSTSATIDTAARSAGQSRGNGNASGPPEPAAAINTPTGAARGMNGAVVGGAMGAGAAGGTVTWNSGDEIQVLWIGLSCQGCLVGMGGGVMGGAAVGGQFSFQQYENLTSGAITNSRSILSTAPLTWVSDPFGVAPRL